MTGWIGVDLDGTLAQYDGWKGEDHIGPPIPSMVSRVRKWVEDGRDVRIFTARVTENLTGNKSRKTPDEMRHIIRGWCKHHIGFTLPITNVKDYQMIELWDDRAVQVIPNTGKRADGHD